MTGSPRRHVVLLFEGRTGSSHLYSMLNGHPRIVFQPEMLMTLRGQGWPAQARWLDDFFAGRLIDDPEKRARSDLTLAFKTKFRDVLDPAAFAAMLRARGAAIIRMRRRNRVKQAVSWIRAHRLIATTGQANVNRRTEHQALPGFAIPPGELRGMLDEMAARESRLDEFAAGLGLARLDLAYEDLLRDRDATLARLLTWMGQAPFAPFVFHRKHTPDDLAVAVANFTELRAAFQGTDYAAEFDVDPAPVSVHDGREKDWAAS